MLHSMMAITVYMIDGFAYAAETLVGQAIGAQRRKIFRDAIRMTTVWAFALAALLSIGLFIGGGMVIDFMTTSAEVRNASRIFLIWTALVPLTSVWCFQLDGIYIGATDTATMRNMMLLAVLSYFATWFALGPFLGNHGLWLSIHVFFVARAVGLAWALPGLERRRFRERAGGWVGLQRRDVRAALSRPHRMAITLEPNCPSIRAYQAPSTMRISRSAPSPRAARASW